MLLKFTHHRSKLRWNLISRGIVEKTVDFLSNVYFLDKVKLKYLEYSHLIFTSHLPLKNLLFVIPFKTHGRSLSSIAGVTKQFLNQ